jgi:uncharacterized protein
MDEVQFMPDMFVQLRPEIDAHRQNGRFLLLGAASGKLLAQSAESLAERVSYRQLAPFLANEVAALKSNPTAVDLSALQALWLKGGFPLSFPAPTLRDSYV